MPLLGTLAAGSGKGFGLTAASPKEPTTVEYLVIAGGGNGGHNGGGYHGGGYNGGHTVAPRHLPPPAHGGGREGSPPDGAAIPASLRGLLPRAPQVRGRVGQLSRRPANPPEPSRPRRDPSYAPSKRPLAWASIV